MWAYILKIVKNTILTLTNNTVDNKIVLVKLGGVLKLKLSKNANLKLITAIIISRVKIIHLGVSLSTINFLALRYVFNDIFLLNIIQ
jgi:hypothetical protein